MDSKVSKQPEHRPEKRPASQPAEQQTPQSPDVVSAEQLHRTLINPRQHPETVLHMQRLYGNQAVMRMLADRQTPSPTRLTIPSVPRHAIQRAEGKIDPGQALPDQGGMARKRFDNLAKYTSAPFIRAGNALLVRFNEIVAAKIVQENEQTARINARMPVPLRKPLIDDAARDTARDGVRGVLEMDNPPDSLVGLINQTKTNLANAALDPLIFEFFHATLPAAANAYMGENALRMDTPHLTDQQKTAFANALKQMPTVKWLMNPQRGATDAVPAPRAPGAVGPAPVGPQSVAAWKGDANLTDRVLFANYNATTKKPIETADAVPNNHAMFARVREADNMLRRMIEAQLLRTLPPPTVYVVKSKKFRAYQSENKIYIAKNEEMPIIVHETSHYLEDHLPTRMWAEIHTMLRARHNARAQSYSDNAKRQLKARTIGSGAMFMRSEGRYRGEYAATGKYTSSAYGEQGSTEVTSMTMEFLANPANAVKMIEKDPQQAAIILRSMRPNEYAATPGLAAFNQYLPG